MWKKGRILVTIGVAVVVLVFSGLGVYYLYQLPPSWATVQEIATFASGIGVAIFTGVVALVEASRFLQGPKISVILKDTLELKTPIIARAKEAYSEFREEVTFQFPIVFANIGARGGSSNWRGIRIARSIFRHSNYERRADIV